jgi:hypothetical protein
MSPISKGRTSLFVRPTLDTKFHIDYDWWDRADRDLGIYLRSHLCSEHQEDDQELSTNFLVDHVDPDTAEVTRMPTIQHVLISHCARQEDYITKQTSFVNQIFRVFLANGNTPTSARDLGHRLGKPPEMILRTLSGRRVYKGIRPFTED